MKTIFKITFICISAFVFNNVNAQNALESRKIQKVEATSAVKAKPVTLEKENAVGIKSNQTQERQEVNPQISTARQVGGETGTAKTPAQMANKPLKKQIVYRDKEAVKKEEVK